MIKDNKIFLENNTVKDVTVILLTTKNNSDILIFHFIK